MKASLKRWGNSLAIRLPQKALHILDLKEDDRVDLIIDKGAVILRKAEKLNPQSLKQLYEDYYGKTWAEIISEQDREEVIMEGPVGNEE